MVRVTNQNCRSWSGAATRQIWRGDDSTIRRTAMPIRRRPTVTHTKHERRLLTNADRRRHTRTTNADTQTDASSFSLGSLCLEQMERVLNHHDLAENLHARSAKRPGGNDDDEQQPLYENNYDDAGNDVFGTTRFEPVAPALRALPNKKTQALR